MSRLSIISDKDMVKLVKSLGFSEVRQNGSHKFFLHSNGRYTVVPVHGEDLKRSLVKGILKDLGITDDEYEELKKNL